MTLITSAERQNITVTMQIRPRYEGSNICTWIGFKHVNYLVEEAILGYFRSCIAPARELYEKNGLCVEIVSIDTRILHAFHMDDLVTAEVSRCSDPAEPELAFSVTLTLEREGRKVKAISAAARVTLRHAGSDDAQPPRPHLWQYVVPRVERLMPTHIAAVQAAAHGAAARDDDPLLAQLTANRNAFAWRFRIPYFYCHFSERMQMSGYLRQMEETVDLFLADRGVSIKRLLDEQNWIPVVPHSSIEIVGEAIMEEELYTVFTVQEIFKDITYKARMDCYAKRAGALVPVATGTITHGYAVIENRRDWSLVSFDQRMLTALRGEG